MRGPGFVSRRRFDDPHADEAARFLDRDVDADDVRPLVRGMDRIARVRAWRAVERALGRGVGGGPRSDVLDLLDDREATLEEIGERPDRLAHGPREDCACCPSYDEWRQEKLELVEQAQADSGRDAVPAATADDVVADAFARTDGGDASGE